MQHQYESGCCKQNAVPYTWRCWSLALLEQMHERCPIFMQLSRSLWQSILMAVTVLVLEEVISAEGASFLDFSKTLPALPHYVQYTDARAKQLASGLK